jgi:hypothetical protein
MHINDNAQANYVLTKLDKLGICWKNGRSCSVCRPPTSDFFLYAGIGEIYEPDSLLEFATKYYFHHTDVLSEKAFIIEVVKLHKLSIKKFGGK